VRYEYCTYKPTYDKGEAPVMIRWRGDPSMEARNIKKSGHSEKFGPPSKVLEMAYDAAQAGEDDDDDSPKRRTAKGKGKRCAEDALEEEQPSVKKSKSVRLIEVDPFVGQAKLDEEDEMLLQLAGAYEEEAESSAKPAQPQVSPAEDMKVIEETVAQETAVEEVVGEQSASAQTVVHQKFTTGASRQVVIDDNYDDEDEDEL